jgi:WD40 repeat protein
MRGYLSNNHRGLFIKAALLIVLLASGVGLYYHAQYQLRRPRVTEFTGLIEAQHHNGPMAFSPDGKTLALPKRSEGRVELWSFETGKARLLVSSFNKSKTAADRIAFSNDGRFLAVYHRERAVTVLDLPANKEQAHITVEPSYVHEMAFADGHQTLVTVTARLTEKDIEANYSAIRWDVSTGRKQEVHVFEPFLQFKALSPDGRYAALQQNDVGQTVFDLATGKKLFAIASEGGFRFSDDGSTLVSYDGHQVSLWDVPSGRELRRFAFKQGYLPRGYAYTDCLSLSPDKKVLAVGGFTETYIVGLIDLESGRVLDTFECCPHELMCDAVCFSPDGRTLATDTYPGDKHDRDVKPLLRFWKMPAW